MPDLPLSPDNYQQQTSRNEGRGVDIDALGSLEEVGMLIAGDVERLRVATDLDDIKRGLEIIVEYIHEGLASLIDFPALGKVLCEQNDRVSSLEEFEEGGTVLTMISELQSHIHAVTFHASPQRSIDEPAILKYTVASPAVFMRGGEGAVAAVHHELFPNKPFTQCVNTVLELISRFHREGITKTEIIEIQAQLCVQKELLHFFPQSDERDMIIDELIQLDYDIRNMLSHREDEERKEKRIERMQRIAKHFKGHVHLTGGNHRHFHHPVPVPF